MELMLKRMLEEAKFSITRKGYDQIEVDDFLDKAVDMATKVEAQLKALTETTGDAGDDATATTPDETAVEPTPPSRSDADIEA